MMQMVFVGIGAGVAAALLFLAPASGSLLAFPLFALTGLPIAIAALGWGLPAGAIASVAGAAVIMGIIPAGYAPFVFLILFGAPVVWLARLVGMSRMVDDAREWFPVGRILFHAAIAIGLALAISGVLTGFDPQGVTNDASAAVAKWLAAAQTDTPPPTAAEIEPIMRLYVSFMPALLALLMVAITLLDLWLATLITRASGRFERPRERLWTVVLPNDALIAFAIALALAFLPGPPGDIASVFAGALLAALVAVGLAVLHAVTLGMNARPALLTAAYLLLLISGLPVIVFGIIGAGENFFRLRARRFAGSSKTQ
jgi:hypothetical protein